MKTYVFTFKLDDPLQHPEVKQSAVLVTARTYKDAEKLIAKEYEGLTATCIAVMLSATRVEYPNKTKGFIRNLLKRKGSEK